MLLAARQSLDTAARRAWLHVVCVVGVATCGTMWCERRSAIGVAVVVSATDATRKVGQGEMSVGALASDAVAEEFNLPLAIAVFKAFSLPWDRSLA